MAFRWTQYLSAHANPTHLPGRTTGMGTTPEQKTSFSHILIQGISAWCLACQEIRILQLWHLEMKRQHCFLSRMIFLLTVIQDGWGTCTVEEVCVEVLWIHLSSDYPEGGKMDTLRFILQQKRFLVELWCRLLHGNACRMQTTEANWKV